MMNRKRFALSVESLEGRVVLTDSAGLLPPISVEMPADEELYPGPDIDETEAQRKEMEATFSEIIRESMRSEPYTGPIPEFPPPVTSGTIEEQSYYDWITEGIQSVIESMSPPDHPIMITP
jgi:hypothetical protein